MNADTLNSLVAEWARADARRPAGYTAPVSALAARLERTHLVTLERVSQAARSDAYVVNGGRFYVVGFRSGPDAVAHAALAKALPRLGFKVSQRAGEFRVTLPPVADVAAQVHASYTSLLNTERAVLAARGV